jgi:NTE family protein
MPRKNKSKRTWDRVAFLFQGGGSMGAFQVGVYKALHEQDYEPDWVGGISIGAINASIIAGNKPIERYEKLMGFWQSIQTQTMFHGFFDLPLIRSWHNFLSSQATVFFGQDNFFSPHLISPFVQQYTSPDKISFYDTRPLKNTLEKYIDFDRLNNGTMRLTLCAARINDATRVTFDNTACKITAKHIMASCALPPGFPAVEIDGVMYWDGGILDNTPLEIIMKDTPKKNTLCFMAQLFNPVAPLPASLDDVMARKKELSYASNYRRVLENFCHTNDMAHAITELYDKLPTKIKHSAKFRHYREMGSKAVMLLVRFQRKHLHGDLSSKDYEFSKFSIEENIEMGYKQANDAIAKSPWLEPIADDIGAILFDMHEDR